MQADYPGQSIGGTKAPSISPVQMNSNWLPEMLNVVHNRPLSSTKSTRWLNDLGIIEEDFYGNIIQQYSASFPRAYSYDAKNKPEFTSNWGVNINVVTTQINWRKTFTGAFRWMK